jgi:argininosuccinate lyase
MLKGKNEIVQNYLSSIPFDRRLYAQDIVGSIAHARMLAKQSIITNDDAKTIESGLLRIKEKIEEGRFKYNPEYEDIHMNIEAELYKEIGEIAGKLHTARSRNDQIALDLRLFLKEQISTVLRCLSTLQEILIRKAEVNISTIIPGYTHLQQAQPILIAHHILAYFDMFQRDKERFSSCYERVDVMPLGSGALAGVTYPIDRSAVAKDLGFSSVTSNSIDAVSDRDFIIEYHAAAAITMMHLSRFADELILWSTSEFGFITINSNFTSGSSIMPQKRNPDIAELIRGKTGRVYGNLMAILTCMKALPLSYNRDLQEDKEGLFDTVDTLEHSLTIFTDMIDTVQFNTEQIRTAFKNDYVLATDIADYLVQKGLPFREAHAVVSRLSNYAVKCKKNFNELSLKEYQDFSPFFDDDVYKLTIDKSISSRDVFGGTAPQQVKSAIERYWKLIKNENK